MNCKCELKELSQGSTLKSGELTCQFQQQWTGLNGLDALMYRLSENLSSEADYIGLRSCYTTVVTLWILDFKTKDNNSKTKQNNKNKNLYILGYSLVYKKPNFSSFQIQISEKNRLTPSFNKLQEPNVRQRVLDHARN